MQGDEVAKYLICKHPPVNVIDGYFATKATLYQLHKLIVDRVCQAGQEMEFWTVRESKIAGVEYMEELQIESILSSSYLTLVSKGIQ